MMPAMPLLALFCAAAPRALSHHFLFFGSGFLYSTRSEMIDHSLLIKRNKNDNVLKSFTVLTVRWLQMVIFLDTTGYYLLYL
jgi:hypothetical protein